jgi:hypothetical protein
MRLRTMQRGGIVTRTAGNIKIGATSFCMQIMAELLCNVGIRFSRDVIASGDTIINWHNILQYTY